LNGEAFAHLSKIDTIMLDDNQITAVAPELTKLTTLTLLDLRKNKIETVSDSWHTVPFFYADPPSMILPHLLLGNVSCSENLTVLNANNVKRIVRAVDLSVQPVIPFESRFRYLTIDCLDTDEQDMRGFFGERTNPGFLFNDCFIVEATNDFIGKSIKADQTVLVHCRQGKSR
jgi:hypothetical protein